MEDEETQVPGTARCRHDCNNPSYQRAGATVSAPAGTESERAAGHAGRRCFGQSRGAGNGLLQASKTPTEAWAKRIESDFGKTSGFALYQMPVLEAVPKVIRGLVISGIKKGVPESERANFVPVLHNEDDLKKLVGFKGEDDAYMVVADRSGSVSYQTHGSSVDPGNAELKGKVQALLK